ncbi:ABC-three component system middle component 6 [Virgibacillus sp. YIM 98842]|uniref:ABC-three component system middle component 6 n=1 Tax=Virgibacillus sp. YIM 98842 TaxID=2663533 RepID=UPI0013D99111|nr:ABC-three component system middle component 6 [Virgibacillus sp. YIM 98842]
MILPQKHIKMSESIFGLSAMILELIDKPTNIDNLWLELQKANIKGDIPGHQTFDNFILCISFLFMIGAICEDKRGRLKLCD